MAATEAAGTQSTLSIKPDEVVRGGRTAVFVEWLKPVLDPEQVLATELTASRKTVGEYINDWGRNGSLADSDQPDDANKSVAPEAMSMPGPATARRRSWRGWGRGIGSGC